MPDPLPSVPRDTRPAGRPIRRSLDDLFAEWITSIHGQAVYLGLVKRAFRMKRAGVSHYGVKAILEAMRFSYTILRGPEAWKVNNNYGSRLGRLAMREYPELAGFFETRELRS
jgi:hypothetical protein